MLAYALILQLVLPPAMAAAAQGTDAAICLSPVTSNAPNAPLKHHGDGLCQSLCAPLSLGTAPETKSELLVLRHAVRAVFGASSVEKQYSHVWDGTRARGPPASV